MRNSCDTKLRFEASVVRRRLRSGLCRVSRIWLFVNFGIFMGSLQGGLSL